jgi:hypothetical protein
MGKITPGLRWIVNGILINCWRTLFQVLVNFYENVMLHLIHLQCLFNFVAQFLNKRRFRSKIGDIAPLIIPNFSVQ